MKWFSVILFCPSLLLANPCPKYEYPENHKLADELVNICQSIQDIPNNTFLSSSMTINGFTVSSITVNRALILNSTTSVITISSMTLSSLIVNSTLTVTGKALFSGNTLSNVGNGLLPSDAATVDQLNPPNIIVNGGFEIWQRGQTFTPGATDLYQADRWLDSLDAVPTSFTIYRDSNTFDTGAYSIHYAIQNVGTAKTVAPAQRIDNKEFYTGMPITCTARMKSDTAGPRIAITDGTNQFLSSPNTGSNTWETLNAGGTLATSISSLNIYVGWVGTLGGANAVNSNFFVDSVVCTTGTYNTVPFFPRPFPQELAMCQRYYEKSYDLKTYPGTATGFANGIVLSAGAQTGATTVIYTMAPYAVSKRATPTITIYDPNGVSGKFFTRSTAGADTQRTPAVATTGLNGFSLDQGAALDFLAIYQWTAESEL